MKFQRLFVLSACVLLHGYEASDASDEGEEEIDSHDPFKNRTLHATSWHPEIEGFDLEHLHSEEVFKHVDLDQSGTISGLEMIEFVQVKQYGHWEKRNDAAQKAHKIFMQYDTDHDSEITKEEWDDFMKNHLRGIIEETMKDEL